MQGNIIGYLRCSNCMQVLLFSYSTQMLDILQRFLRKEGYSFSRIDGSVPVNKRQFIMDDFNRNPNKMVFLISTKAGGLGLNLTCIHTTISCPFLIILQLRMWWLFLILIGILHMTSKRRIELTESAKRDLQMVTSRSYGIY